MSDAHSHAHAGPDHVPHVSPLSLYLKTFGALMVLTVITVGASYIDLGTSVNLAVAIIIATIKATVVATFFMHLITDSKFHAIALVSSVVFLAIFVGFTMLDTTARGQYESARRGRPAVMTDPFAAPSAATSAAPKASSAPAAGSAAPSAAASAAVSAVAPPSAEPSAAPSASAVPAASATPAVSAAASARPAASAATSTK